MRTLTAAPGRAELTLWSLAGVWGFCCGASASAARPVRLEAVRLYVMGSDLTVSSVISLSICARLRCWSLTHPPEMRQTSEGRASGPIEGGQIYGGLGQTVLTFFRVSARDNASDPAAGMLLESRKLLYVAVSARMCHLLTFPGLIRIQGCPIVFLERGIEVFPCVENPSETGFSPPGGAIQGESPFFSLHPAQDR